MFIDANILQPLISAFEAVIKFFHNEIGASWGWSIILLTVAIRLVLVPLTVKQFHSMQKLQRLTPEIKRIQAKYKQDKQRQQQELMKLYQEHGVNPFSSCLPFVVQIPVLYALFFMLRSSLRADICPTINGQLYNVHHAANGHLVHNATLKACGANHGAGFLFIPDLTNHATGGVLIALMVLYVVTQLGSSLLMSSPTMDKRQRQMMLVLPLVFVFIIIGLPAGVIVYWITTNALLVIQQYGVKRLLGPVTPVTATGGEAAAGRDGEPPARGAPKKGAPQRERPATPAPAEGNGAGGGLAGLLRGRPKPEEKRETVAAGTRARSSGPPPRSPRKKKKRSGRRR
jgi:YidC/Oxa1 family membrane protein insertase